MPTPISPREHGSPSWLARELSFRLEQEQKRGTLSGPVSKEIHGRLLPTWKAWQLYFTQEVAFDWRLSTQMYFLTLATGLLDVTTFQAYKVFATKMTGNLLLLAIDAMNKTDVSATLEQNVATAVGAFIIGAAAFGHIGRLVGRRRRAFLLASNTLQTSLVFAAVAIQYWGGSPELGIHAVVKMALLAFAMAGQVSLAIGVGLPELNTTMITSSLIQLCYDPKIFKADNAPRTKRLAFIIVMVIGHFAGAAASRYSTALGFLLTACVKSSVTLSFLFNPGVVMKFGDTESCETKSGAITPAAQVLWGD